MTIRQTGRDDNKVPLLQFRTKSKNEYILVYNLHKILNGIYHMMISYHAANNLFRLVLGNFVYIYMRINSASFI